MYHLGDYQTQILLAVCHGLQDEAYYSQNRLNKIG